MSDTNNNIPTRITQLEEATEYEDGMFYAVAKAGRGTYKIPVDEMTPNEQALSDKIEDEIVPAVENSFAYGTVDESEIASFQDGSELPLKVLEVAVNPVQDLHGYDAPWAGGAGKNKLAMDISDIKSLNTAGTWNGNTYTVNGAEYKINIDTAGNITSINARSVASNPNGDLKIATTIPADSYILSSGFTETNGVNDTFLQKNGVTIARGNNSSPGPNFTITESSEVVLHIRLSRNDSSFICTPMIRLASVTDATFAPYSNECPIIGWSAVDVNVSGKNLFDKTTIGNGNIEDANGTVKNPTAIYRHTDYIKVVGGESYYIKTSQTSGNWGAWYDKNKNYITGVTQYADSVITAPSNAVYMRLTILSESYVDSFGVNYPSTDTEYHAYNGQTITIQLGDTYYGGELDVVSGVLTVDRIYKQVKDFDWRTQSGYYGRFFTVPSGADKALSDSNKPLIISDTYKGYSDVDKPANTNGIYIGSGGSIKVWDSEYIEETDIDAWKTARANVELCYYLATPIEIQLTPTQVKSLKGYNNISADTGNILKVEYIRDLDIVINSLLERIAALEG